MGKNRIWSKCIVYIFNIILFCMGLIASGERTNQYVRSINPFYTLYIEKSEINAEFMEDLYQVFEEYDVDVLVNSIKFNSALQRSVYTLYGSEDALAKYTEKTGITEGIKLSLFSTDTEYCFAPYEDAVSCDGTFIKIYLLSDENLKRTIPASVLKDLALGDISGKNVDVKGELQKQNASIWLLVFAAMLLFTYYSCLQQKREIYVRVSLGEGLGKIISGNIAADTTVYVMAVFAAIGTIGKWVSLKITGEFWVEAAVFLVCNAGWYLSLRRYSFQKALSGKGVSKKLLVMSHIVRGAAIIMVIVLVQINWVYGKEFWRYKKNNDFFELHKQSYSINIDNSFQIYGDYVYLQETDKGNSELYLLKGEVTDGRETVYPYIQMNQGSFSWLQTKYPFLKKEMPEDVVILYPEKFVNAGELEGNLDANGYGDEKDWRTGYYSYRGMVEVPEIRGNDFSNDLQWAQNPVILIDKRNNMLQYGEHMIDSWGTFFNGAYLVNFPSDTFEEQELTMEDGTKVSFQSVYKGFHSEYEAWYSGYLAESTVTALLLLLEIMVSSRIIYLEFENNAEIFILKRITGESIIRTYGWMFAVTTALCLVGGMIAQNILEIEMFAPMTILAAGIIWICEIGIACIGIFRLESKGFIGILKGSSF